MKCERFREFRNPYQTTDVAVEAIMDFSQKLGIGYLGWTWSGYKANDPNQHLPPDYTPLNSVTISTPGS